MLCATLNGLRGWVGFRKSTTLDPVTGTQDPYWLHVIRQHRAWVLIAGIWWRGILYPAQARVRLSAAWLATELPRASGGPPDGFPWIVLRGEVGGGTAESNASRTVRYRVRVVLAIGAWWDESITEQREDVAREIDGFGEKLRGSFWMGLSGKAATRHRHVCFSLPGRFTPRQSTETLPIVCYRRCGGYTARRALTQMKGGGRKLETGRLKVTEE